MAKATRWQSCEDKDPRAGWLKSQSLHNQRSQPSSLFDSFEVWRQKRLRLLKLPLLQPGAYNLNKPGIPLPWVNLSTYPSIHLHTHPHIQPSVHPLNIYEYIVCTTERAMAPHSSTLAWKIPWTEEPGRLQSMGSRRVAHDWATSLSLFTFMHWRRKWQPTPVFLPGESQGPRSLVGCRLWGHTESDTTDVT